MRQILPLLLAAACTLLPGTLHALGGRAPVAVSVQGQVHRPGAYTLPPGSTLSSLILAAGGFTESADLGGAALLRVSSRTAQEAELQGLASRLQDDAAGAASGSGAAGSIARQLREMHPAGRVPVRLAHPRLLRNSPDDIPLEDGDLLSIPAAADTVTVAGAVRSPARRFAHVKGRRYEEYIREAGGYADDADRRNVFLLRADGTAALLSLGPIAWNPAAGRWEIPALTGGPPPVGPGDTIVVPRLLPRELPARVARELPGILRRAAEIAGAPVELR